MKWNFQKSDFRYLTTLESLNISFKGENRIILKEDPAFTKMSAAIKSEDWNTLAKLLMTSETLRQYSEGDMYVTNGKVHVATKNGYVPVSDQLSDTIRSFIAQELPHRPLVCFAQKLQENPSERSIEQLFSFVSANKLTITEDGDFITYKRVRHDFKDMHSGRFDNSVGKVVEMPREQVVDDPNVTCAAGLHVAAYEYAHHTYGGLRGEYDGVTLICKVNPRDVVSVPTDYHAQKMRVCRYEVIAISEKEIKDDLYRQHTPKSIDDLDEDNYEEDEDDDVDFNDDNED